LLVALLLSLLGGLHVSQAADARSTGVLLVANKGDHSLGSSTPTPAARSR
jgi:hypothetical protein